MWHVNCFAPKQAYEKMRWGQKMAYRYLLAVALVAIGLCAPVPAHAVFVLSVQVRSAAAELPATLQNVALAPAPAGEALCVDRTLCQPWTETMDTIWTAASAPNWVSPTLMANLALVALGLLWILLTRRSLLVARDRAK